MNNYQRLSRAYQTAVNLRSQRERDADVFDIFAARLREGESQGGLTLSKALADNVRLWQTVTAATLDDNNPQPPQLRRALLALANAVTQAMASSAPDIRFLVETNCNMAAGLRGERPKRLPEAAAALTGGIPMPAGSMESGAAI